MLMGTGRTRKRSTVYSGIISLGVLGDEKARSGPTAGVHRRWEIDGHGILWEGSKHFLFLFRNGFRDGVGVDMFLRGFLGILHGTQRVGCYTFT